MADEPKDEEGNPVNPILKPSIDEKEIRWQSIVRTVVVQRDSAMNTIAQLQGEIEVLQARYANKKN